MSNATMSILSERYNNAIDAEEMIGRKVVPYDREFHETGDVPMPVVDVFTVLTAGIPSLVFRVEIDGLLTDCRGDALLDVEVLIDEYLEASIDWFDTDPHRVRSFIKSAKAFRDRM